MMEKPTYADGTEIKEGDRFSYTGQSHEVNGVVEEVVSDRVIWRTSKGECAASWHSSIRKWRLVSRAQCIAPYNSYATVAQADGYKLGHASQYPADKEKKTMKKAYKAYIIEV